MFEKVKEILLDFTSENITPESTLVSDLGLSSFDVVSVVSEFEDEFDIEIPDRDIHKLITIQDVIAYIEEKSEN